MEKTTSKGKEVVIKIYGETLDQYHDILLIKEDNIAFNSFIQAMKKYIQKSLFDPDFKSTSRIIKPTFYDYFYTEEMSEEEKIKIKKIVDSYIEKTTSKGKEIVIKIYGETLDQYQDVKLSKGERNALHALKISITRSIEKTLSNQKNIALPEPTAVLSSKEQNNKNIEKLSDINFEHLNYLEQLIIKLYNNSNDIDQVCKLLMISEDNFIECYLKYPAYFKNEDNILEHILLSEANIDNIRRLLCSPLFDDTLGLTDIEKSILYMKLLQFKNQSITDELISQITGIDLESIKNYQLMTKEDKVNQLNKFLRRNG